MDGDMEGENVIGMGAKNVVYKGSLPDGKVFAIKTLRGDVDSGTTRAEKSQWETDLIREVQILARLRHRNLLKVLGFYSSLDLKAIILEYMPRGSLHGHLYPSEGRSCELLWDVRFRIATEMCEGMKYLHHDFPEPLVHRDLKPRNILLDEDLSAKVADFGLSKYTNPHRGGEASASAIHGTVGYMPPEYALGTYVSTKGDVFSYGIILLELLTGKWPIPRDSSESVSAEDYRGWILKLFKQAPRQLLGSTLLEECTVDSTREKQILLVTRIALLCTSERPQSRPSMIDVREILYQVHGRGALTVRNMEDLEIEINSDLRESDQDEVKFAV